MLGEGWEDQYKRLQRQYGLLKRSSDSNGEYNDLLDEEGRARDILYHFCCDAFHLCDWIRKSSLPQNVRDDLALLLNTNGTGTSVALSACADIANGSKHLKLTKRSYRTGATSGHAEVVDQIQAARLPKRFPVHFGANIFTIDVGGGVQRDALDLARDATGVPPAFRTADQIRSDPERMKGIVEETPEIHSRVS
jgi:hypothetical protein